MTEWDQRYKQIQYYEVSRRPYVEVTDDGKYHAQVIGWIPGEIFIEYPRQISEYKATGRLHPKWVPTGSAVRIRRSDSIWLSVEDDDDWHEVEDAKVTFRPDPWTVYTQDDTGHQ